MIVAWIFRFPCHARIICVDGKKIGVSPNAWGHIHHHWSKRVLSGNLPCLTDLQKKTDCRIHLSSWNRTMSVDFWLLDYFSRSLYNSGFFSHAWGPLRTTFGQVSVLSQLHSKIDVQDRAAYLQMHGATSTTIDRKEFCLEIYLAWLTCRKKRIVASIYHHEIVPCQLISDY
jgi:hypothetical protein